MKILAVWMKKERKAFIILFIVYVASCLSAFCVSRFLTGPITFGDEYVYMNLAKQIHFEHGFRPDVQYNPLYPLITSLFYGLKNYAAAYDGIKIFNACMFSTVVFPVYILCRKLLKNRILCCVLSAAFLFFPWRSCTTVVWAEPLYYPLFAWTVLLAYRFFETGKKKNLLCFSFLAGMLFLTKQAGVLLLVSTVLTVFIFDIINKAGWKEILKKLVCGLTPGMVCIIIWQAYRSLNSGGGGYQVEVDKIKDNLFNIKDILINIAYNVSYYSIATFFVVGVLFLYTLIHVNKLKRNQQMLTVNIFLCTAMIMVLCAFHYIGLSMPYGRYQTTVLPFLFLIGAMGYESLKMDKWKLIIINILLLFITLFFNPIYSFLAVKGFFNQADISIWTKLLLGDRSMPFHLLGGETASLLDHIWEPQLIVLLYFCVSTVILLLLQRRWNKTAVTLICLATGIVMAGGTAGHYWGTKSLANGGTPINDVYRYLSGRQAGPDNVYKTGSMIGNQYLDAVWMPGVYWIELEDGESGSVFPIKDAYSIMMDSELRFDFGGEKTPEAEGTCAIKAPWVPGYYYEPQFGNIGFDLKKSVDMEKGSASIFYIYDKTAEDALLSDGIGGEYENSFTVYAQKGNYHINIKSEPELLKAAGDVEFEVYINDRYSGKISQERKSLTIEKFYNTKDTLEVKVAPKNGNYWFICSIEIIPEEVQAYHNVYLMALKDSEYPLPCVFENKYYKIYYKE